MVDQPKRRLLRTLPAFLGALALSPSGCTPDSHKIHNQKIELTHISKIALGLTPFPIERLAIIREEAGLAAISLVCTHQDCLLNTADSEPAFYCPCHGSEFGKSGQVLHGPATQDLPWYRVDLSPEGLVQVYPTEKVSSNWRLKL